MTLFIACLIIYQFGMSPWLYAVAVLVWAARTAIMVRTHINTYQAIEGATRAAKEAARVADSPIS